MTRGVRAMRRSTVFCMLAGVMLGVEAYPQSLPKPFWISWGLGGMRIEGDQDSAKIGPLGMISFGYHLSPYAAISVHAAGGWSRGSVPDTNWHRTDVGEVGAELRILFRPLSRITPFVGVGGGAVHWRAKDTGGSWMQGGRSWTQRGTELYGCTTAGLEFRLNQRLSLHVGVRYSYVLNDELDVRARGSEDDQVASAFASLSLRLGRWFADDADDDGVPKALDLDPRRAEDPDGYLDHDGAPEPPPPLPLASSEGEDDTSPVVIHHPVRVAVEGHTIPVRAQVFEDRSLRIVALVYRPIGTDKWNAVRMTPMLGNAYMGRIPGFDVRRPGVEYLVAAVDRALNAPGVSGTPDRPHVVRLISDGTGWKVVGGILGVLSWGGVGYLLMHRE